MTYRIEKDSIGEIAVPAEHYWGAQTERSRQFFAIGREKMPDEVIVCFSNKKPPAVLGETKALATRKNLL